MGEQAQGDKSLEETGMNTMGRRRILESKLKEISH